MLHPDILLESLTNEQWQGWIDFYNRRPWGFSIENLRAALNAQASANSFGGRVRLTTFLRILQPGADPAPLQQKILHVFFGPNGPPPATA